jgi:HlyD family secretion protein
VEADKVFRQAVLDRLASPEKLHTLMRVTDAKGWLALVGCGLLLVTALTWGVLGSIPTKLEASGLLIYSGGLADVIALGSGQVTAIEVDVGDHVQEGQVVAQVAQPALREQILSLEARLGELKANYQKTKSAGGRDVGLRLRATSEARRNIESGIAANEQRAQELQARLEKQEELQQKGLITGEKVDATREALRSARITAQTLRADLGRLDVDNFSAQRANQSALMADQMQIQDTERQITLLREQLDKESRVTSTHTGRVVEVRATVGDLLVPGTPIVSLERLGKTAGLEALLYVDSREGKIVTAGMEVQVAPTIVRKERYGVVIGKIKSVESFPSTRQGMMRVLHNEQLVNTLLQDTAGAPIAVRAKLIRDESTPSGYKWSSKEGPDLVLTSGTRCAAYVTTHRQRPISLVLPSLDLDGR